LRGRPPLRVAVVSGTRAEFGLLASPLREMRRRPRLEVRLIAAGMHLLPKFGRTLEHIEQAGFTVDATVSMQSGRDDPCGEALAVGRGVTGLAGVFDRLRSQVVVVLGDRIEAFAAAAAAAAGRRVVAHIHGGDRAAGDVDDALRNAITRLAHVHLVASADARRRLLRMGEPPERIHRVGAPGLDDIRVLRTGDRTPAGRAETDRRVRALLGELAGRPYVLILQHPCGHGPAREAAIMRAVLQAVSRADLAGVVLYPNSDPGHDGIVAVIRELRDRRRWRVFRSLPREDFIRLALRARAMVGNSSSGLIESASLGLNAVNVGPRQAGRLKCGPGVIDVPETSAGVFSGLRRALQRRRPAGAASVYGDGRAGARIADVLESLIITPAITRKSLTY